MVFRKSDRGGERVNKSRENREQVKSIRVSLCLTPVELKMIEQAAKKMGVKRSTFIRATVISSITKD